MKPWMKFVALVVVFAFAIYLTSYISRLPDSNCSTRQVSKSWSRDHAYSAALLRKECNLGDTAFYSARIAKPGAWFLKIEVEEDPYPAEAVEPTMTWDAHRLRIDIPAEKFTGSIERREGDLTVVRSYIPPKP
jgi:hypothetical protein